jgi:hypothetical protein
VEAKAVGIASGIASFCDRHVPSIPISGQIRIRNDEPVGPGTENEIRRCGGRTSRFGQ